MTALTYADVRSLGGLADSYFQRVLATGRAGGLMSVNPFSPPSGLVQSTTFHYTGAGRDYFELVKWVRDICPKASVPTPQPEMASPESISVTGQFEFFDDEEAVAFKLRWSDLMSGGAR